MLLYTAATQFAKQLKIYLTLVHVTSQIYLTSIATLNASKNVPFNIIPDS